MFPYMLIQINELTIKPYMLAWKLAGSDRSFRQYSDLFFEFSLILMPKATNGSVPGPLIICHEGDMVELTLRNPSDSTCPCPTGGCFMPNAMR